MAEPVSSSSNRNLPSVTNVEVFSPLEKIDLPSGIKDQTPTQRKAWLPGFTEKHLPCNRLKAKEDDMRGRFISFHDKQQNKPKKKKKKVKAMRSIHSRNFSGSCGIAAAEQKYSTYLPLQQLWQSYLEDLLQLDGEKVRPSVFPIYAQKLMKADLHGCPLTVRQSKCPSYIGVEGIVTQETRNMFTLISADDKVRRIPKANSIFSFPLHGCVFSIHGNQFLIRPGERASRKFKSKSTIDF